MATHSENFPSMQQDMLRRRLPVVVAGLIFISIALITRMVLFQAPNDPRVAAYVERVRSANYSSTQRQTSARGIIYDRTGQRLAVNSLQYRVGLSADIISNPDEMVQQLSTILNLDPLRVNQIVRSRTQYALLANNVNAATYQELVELDSPALGFEQIPRRYYPQGIAAPLIGFVAGSGDGFIGYNGVEGYYEEELAGRTRQADISNIPFDVPAVDDAPEKGADLVLTIDRDIQYLVEEALAAAIAETGAQSGDIIIMDPNTGDILAMASYPTFDGNAIPDDNDLLRNPAVSDVYEPGSVMKVITMAAALQEGVISPDWVYNDEGRYIVGGLPIENWDRRAHGVVDAETVLVESLNIGAAKLAVEELGRNRFYNMIGAFGFGTRTRVDLQGEASGIVRVPGDARWSESDLGANAYGQGISVTTLQMLNAVNVIANGGLLIQPRVVKQVIRGTEVTDVETIVLRRVLSEEVARQVTQLMVAAVDRGLDDLGRVDGYAVAGKTGTAEISSPIGYLDGQTNVSFVGFLPADAPQVSIIVKLNRPTSNTFASQTAAPVFKRLAEKLVTYLEIPTDADRVLLVQQGGNVGKRQ